jgi:hypothetical protein
VNRYSFGMLLERRPPTKQKQMKTSLKIFVAGAVITILASAFAGCSPVIVRSARPRPVVYSSPVSALPQQVIVSPVVPLWAPPYAYVTEVHYYYFPDYMIYYEVFSQNYCYYNGYNWLHVTMLPSLPAYYNFNPYSSYLIVLNSSANQPWMNHTFYEEQYPTGYYRNAYVPRTTLQSNTVLRAYDENQQKPLFVDQRTNKEVLVNYEVRTTQKMITRNSSQTKIITPLGNNVQIKKTPENNNDLNDNEKTNKVKQPSYLNTTKNSELNNFQVRSQETINNNNNNTSRQGETRTGSSRSPVTSKTTIFHGNLRNSASTISSNSQPTNSVYSKFGASEQENSSRGNNFSKDYLLKSTKK